MKIDEVLATVAGEATNKRGDHSVDGNVASIPPTGVGDSDGTFDFTERSGLYAGRTMCNGEGESDKTSDSGRSDVGLGRDCGG